MKVVVLGGSPKGDQSVTMQYVKYLETGVPDIEWNVIQIASKIRAIEKEDGRFQSVIDEIASAGAILWAFPLYFMLVCSQYKRFIELVFERQAQAAFSGKYAASLSTSIHFYDHTAHNYIQAISDDLGMRFVDSYSANMHDLFNREGRAAVLAFGQKFETALKERFAYSKQFYPVSAEPRFTYTRPTEVIPAVDGQHATRITIVADRLDGNLAGMVARLEATLPQPVRVVELASVRTTGGCLGCLKCAPKNVCAYTGKDDFIETMRESLLPADTIVFAGTVVDRYFSWIWKRFFDRSFFNTHTPWLDGKRFAFLVAGPWSKLDNLREIMMAYVEMQHGEFLGSVSDECATAEELDSIIAGLGTRITTAVESGRQPVPAATFRGVAGLKLFRDEVYLGLRAVFKVDHRYYRTHGTYDFPHRRIGSWFAAAFLNLLTSIPAVQKKMTSEMSRMMVLRYRKVVTLPPGA